MKTPLLTIIVPTYNRSASLQLLLRTLMQECVALGDAVRVLVSDNASTDDTPEVTCRAKQAWPELTVQRHPVNLGPEENFCTGIDRLETRWFWIIGDDDCPKRGVVAAMITLLRRRDPALVYMRSEWTNRVTGPDQGEPVGKLRVEAMDPLSYARRVHVWLTFISGTVVDAHRLKHVLAGRSIRHFTGTSLVQLGWVLPMLQVQGPLLYVRNRCVLATSDNTGGYGLLTVFGINFPRLVKSEFGSNPEMIHSILRPTLFNYLPALVWQSRGRKAASFKQEQPWAGMKEELGNYLAYRTIVVPIGKLPTWLARCLFVTWRVGQKVSAAARWIGGWFAGRHSRRSP